MRLVISIQRGSYPRYSVSLSAFFSLCFSCEMELQCTLRLLSLSLSFSLARFQRCESTIILFSPLLPLCHQATLIRAPRWRRSAVRPTLALFSYGFSPPPTLADPLSSLCQPPLSHLLLPSPLRLPLLPTGPHENTYFTGIHDGRRASVQTCLPSLPQTGRARPLSSRQRLLLASLTFSLLSLFL